MASTTHSVPVNLLFYCSSFTWKPADCKISCVCVCFVRCSFGQFGLWEDLRVVQCGGVGQSNRRRAEPGQRRGAESCSQILSGGQTAAQLRSDLWNVWLIIVRAAIISLPLKASGGDVSRANKKNRFHSGQREGPNHEPDATIIQKSTVKKCFLFLDVWRNEIPNELSDPQIKTSDVYSEFCMIRTRKLYWTCYCAHVGTVTVFSSYL